MYRLLLIAAVLAAKFYDDKFYKNSYYAEVGGISLAELNELEHLFLDYLEFKLVLDPEEYEMYKSKLMGNFRKNSTDEPEGEFNVGASGI
jgi:hypothetical protein